LGYACVIEPDRAETRDLGCGEAMVANASHDLAGSVDLVLSQ
jgi:hypothetical protein